MPNPPFLAVIKIQIASNATAPDAEKRAFAAPARSAVMQGYLMKPPAKREWVGGRQPTLENANGGFEKQIEDLVEVVDRMRAFYRQLGWKESNADTDPRSVFEKRFRHYEVFSTAVGHSKFDDTCKVISTEDDFLSIPHLAKTIFDDLKSDPIR